MKIGAVLGTRPEIVKMAPVLRALQDEGETPWLLHTGQHYDPEMDSMFMEDLQLPIPDVRLHVGSGLHGAQTGAMLAQIEAALMDAKPDLLLVQGDTNSVLAAALAAVKLQIPIGHVEAGLRSGDRRMPEEMNRILTDHMSDWLYVHGPPARQILLDEGFRDHQIIETGNTVVDAAVAHAEIARAKSTIHDRLSLDHEYAVATVHRQENVDDPIVGRRIIGALERLAEEMPVVFPMHPRARTRFKEAGIKTERLTVVDPLGYFDFLALLQGARLVLSDSGGVQQESCILGVPCVTLRTTTELPETVAIGANVLAGTDARSIEDAVAKMLRSDRGWKHDLGKGDAGVRIARHCLQMVGGVYGD